MITYKIGDKKFVIDNRYVAACTKAVTQHLEAARERSENLGVGLDYYTVYIIVLYVTTRAIIEKLPSTEIMRLASKEILNRRTSMDD